LAEALQIFWEQVLKSKRQSHLEPKAKTISYQGVIPPPFPQWDYLNQNCQMVLNLTLG
jgi:hypothetical protein